MEVGGWCTGEQKTSKNDKKTKNHPVQKQTLITGTKEYKTIFSLKYK